MIHKTTGKIISKDRRNRPVTEVIVIYRCDQCGLGWSDESQACGCGIEEAGEAVAALVLSEVDEGDE